MAKQNPIKNLSFPSHMAQILDEIVNGKEYEIDFKISKPIIADVGANVGIFTYWALNRWQDSIVYCYEPMSFNFKFLYNNFKDNPRVKLYNLALGNPKRKRLYFGRSNCGQSSFYRSSQTIEKYENVNTISPLTIPDNCDILKIDTEGNEVEILSYLKERSFKVILLEYHSESDRKKIMKMLFDYKLVESHKTWGDQGVLKFIHI